MVSTQERDCQATAPQAVYAFTESELQDLLRGAIGMFIEYRDRHGRDEESAAPCAVSELMDGLRAEDELHAFGECHSTHTLPASLAQAVLQARGGAR